MSSEIFVEQSSRTQTQLKTADIINLIIISVTCHPGRDLWNIAGPEFLDIVWKSGLNDLSF